MMLLMHVKKWYYKDTKRKRGRSTCGDFASTTYCTYLYYPGNPQNRKQLH